MEETIAEVSKKHSPTGQRYLAKPYPKDNEPRTFGVRQAWLDAIAPKAPTATIKGVGNDRRLILKPGAGEEPFTYAVWTLRETSWSLAVVPASATEIPLRGAPARVVVKAVDRLGNTSMAVEAN